MKRKLDQDDIPDSVQQSEQPQFTENFESMRLDSRLIQAITKEGFSKPTAIQSRAVPVALQGSDVVARAKTGTGKTAAYLLPILQYILSTKSSSPTSISALILVPTRELASQVDKALQTFTLYCSKDIRSINLALDVPEQALRARLVGIPDVVIATPAGAKHHMERSVLSAEGLRWLVVDEADLVMSYGHQEDFQALVGLLPTRGLQVFLASATLTDEVDKLNSLLCNDPAVLDMQDEERAEQSTVGQYVVKCGEDDKFLLLVAVFKLKLVSGKCIIFVGDIDRCYRIKMLLEQFGVHSCVLNSELPVNSRGHVIDEFNKGVYDIIIATDEIHAPGTHEMNSLSGTRPSHAHARPKGAGQAYDSKPDNAHKKSKHDSSFGISRGIDFQFVTCVLNFDLPTSARSYTHRIGRTGRLGRSGLALSFVVPAFEYRKHKQLSFPTTQHDEAVLVAIRAAQEKRGKKVEDYTFDMQPLQALWYRVSSALKVITPGAVRQTRLKELREELLKSEKLKRHLEENPEDLRWLRHDQETRMARVQPHLKILPDYLIPVSGASSTGLEEIGFVGPGRQSENRIRRARQFSKAKTNNRRKRADPLRTFKARKK